MVLALLALTLVSCGGDGGAADPDTSQTPSVAETGTASGSSNETSGQDPSASPEALPLLANGKLLRNGPVQVRAPKEWSHRGGTPDLWRRTRYSADYTSAITLSARRMPLDMTLDELEHDYAAVSPVTPKILPRTELGGEPAYHFRIVDGSRWTEKFGFWRDDWTIELMVQVPTSLPAPERRARLDAIRSTFALR